ncbi:MAG: hypothetical protein JSV80_06485 [Acidobacteriota bacterium]|nr:MAG: hypothetical protein JSV80_06485 [Acidobacteriota bacterium]
MERTFSYTKRRLRFILQDLLKADILESSAYRSHARAEEGFEKRAAIEFALWFFERALPENFSFQCRFSDLEQDYAADIAERIRSGKGWSSRHVRERESADNVVFVDFRDKDLSGDPGGDSSGDD